MHVRTLILLCLMLVATTSTAGDLVYKCTGADGSVVFTDSRCDSGADTTLMDDKNNYDRTPTGRHRMRSAESHRWWEAGKRTTKPKRPAGRTDLGGIRVSTRTTITRAQQCDDLLRSYTETTTRICRGLDDCNRSALQVQRIQQDYAVQRCPEVTGRAPW